MVNKWKKTASNSSYEEWTKGEYPKQTLLTIQKDGSVLVKEPKKLTRWLVGGNSNKQIVSTAVAKQYNFTKTTKSQARKIAMSYMRNH